MTEEQCIKAVIKFSSIRKMGMGFDFGRACKRFLVIPQGIYQVSNMQLFVSIYLHHPISRR